MREFRTAICISQSPDITAIRVDLIKSKMMPHLVVRYALRFTQTLSLKLTAPKLSMEGSYYGVCLHRDIETITAHVPRIKGFLNSNVFFFCFSLRRNGASFSRAPNSIARNKEQAVRLIHFCAITLHSQTQCARQEKKRR